MTFFEWLTKGGDTVDCFEACLALVAMGVFWRLARDPK